MSASFMSTVIVGSEIDKKYLYKEKTVRSCSCTPTENVKFCPHCASPYFETKKIAVEGYDAEDGDDGTIDGLKIVHTTDQNRSFLAGVSGKGFWIGNDGDEAEKIDIPNIDEVKKRVKVALLKIDHPWKEEDFGIWSVGYCSY